MTWVGDASSEDVLDRLGHFQPGLLDLELELARAIHVLALHAGVLGSAAVLGGSEVSRSRRCSTRSWPSFKSRSPSRSLRRAVRGCPGGAWWLFASSSCGIGMLAAGRIQGASSSELSRSGIAARTITLATGRDGYGSRGDLAPCGCRESHPGALNRKFVEWTRATRPGHGREPGMAKPSCCRPGQE